MRIALKACPRCRGDLIPDDSDRTGTVYACLQCGAEVPYERIGARSVAGVRRVSLPPAA